MEKIDPELLLHMPLYYEKAPCFPTEGASLKIDGQFYP